PVLLVVLTAVEWFGIGGFDGVTLIVDVPGTGDPRVDRAGDRSRGAEGAAKAVKESHFGGPSEGDLARLRDCSWVLRPTSQPAWTRARSGRKRLSPHQRKGGCRRCRGRSGRPHAQPREHTMPQGRVASS